MKGIPYIERKSKARKQYEQFMGRATCPFCGWISTRKTSDARINNFRDHLLTQHSDKDDDEIDDLIDQEKV